MINPLLLPSIVHPHPLLRPFSYALFEMAHRLVHQTGNLFFEGNIETGIDGVRSTHKISTIDSFSRSRNERTPCFICEQCWSGCSPGACAKQRKGVGAFRIGLVSYNSKKFTLF